MEEIAKGLCADYISEAWRTGFAAGCAIVFGIVIIAHIAMRIFYGKWGNFEEKEKGE